MATRAIACVLACQLAVPVDPAVAGGPRQEDDERQWVEVTLVGLDPAQRTVSYRVEPRPVEVAAVGSEAVLRKLTALKAGQRVKLKCRQTGDGTLVVEEAKKARSGPKWWLWGIVTAAVAGVVWLLLLFHDGE